MESVWYLNMVGLKKNWKVTHAFLVLTYEEVSIDF